MKKIAPETILTIAKQRDYCVHIYSYRHEKVRKLTRRMCKDRLLVMTMRAGDYFVYRSAEGNKV
jgi:hypothetical protein